MSIDISILSSSQEKFDKSDSLGTHYDSRIILRPDSRGAQTAISLFGTPKFICILPSAIARSSSSVHPRLPRLRKRPLDNGVEPAASPEFYVAELFVIVRPNGKPRERGEVPRLPRRSEPRESLNDVTFVVSLPRRRAFARLNCKLRLHSLPSLFPSCPCLCPPPHQPAVPRARPAPPSPPSSQRGFLPQLSFPQSRFIAVTLERFIFSESPA